jgi:hypothetical protein
MMQPAVLFPVGVSLVIPWSRRGSHSHLPPAGQKRALQVFLRDRPHQLGLLSLVGSNISVADAIIHRVPFNGPDEPA